MVISQSFLNHALLQRFNDSDVLLSIRGKQVLNLKLICALCVLAGLLKFVHTFIRLTLPQDFVIVRISCHCSSRRSRTVSSKLHENCVASNVRNTLHVSMQRMSLATTIWVHHGDGVILTWLRFVDRFSTHIHLVDIDYEAIDKYTFALHSY